MDFFGEFLLACMELVVAAAAGFLCQLGDHICPFASVPLWSIVSTINIIRPTEFAFD